MVGEVDGRYRQVAFSTIGFFSGDARPIIAAVCFIFGGGCIDQRSTLRTLTHD